MFKNYLFNKINEKCQIKIQNSIYLKQRAYLSSLLRIIRKLFLAESLRKRIKERVCKNIKDILKNIIIIVLLVVILNACYSKIIRKDKIIKIFGKSILIVKTGSMEHTIKEGELIIISSQKKYDIGDVVTIVDDDGYIVTHRIINISNDKIITKGDGNNIADEENSANKIIGKVIFHSKLLGIISVYLLKPITYFYIVIFLLSSIISKRGGLIEKE